MDEVNASDTVKVASEESQGAKLECDYQLSHLRAPLCAMSDALCIGRGRLEAPVALPVLGELGCM